MQPLPMAARFAAFVCFLNKTSATSRTQDEAGALPEKTGRHSYRLSTSAWAKCWPPDRTRPGDENEPTIYPSPGK
jgi:hypothetical protein